MRKLIIALAALITAVACFFAPILASRAQDATSTALQLLYMGNGLHQNDWGTQTNGNLAKIEAAIAGSSSIVVGALDYTMSDTEARSGILVVTGTLSANLNIVAPARTKSWIISNQTSGAFTITFKPSGGTGVALPQGLTVVAWTNGATTRLISVDLSAVNANVSAVTTVANAALPKAGGTMTGGINHGGFIAANIGAPSTGTDATTKTYVDAAIAAAVAAVPTGIPSGAVMAFNLSSCPAGWLAADGTAVALDLRGEFIRGWSNGRSGVDTGRTLASAQADIVKDHTHSPGGGGSSGQGNYALGANGYNAFTATVSGGMTSGGGTETRPRNVALLYCVKS